MHTMDAQKHWLAHRLESGRYSHCCCLGPFLEASFLLNIPRVISILVSSISILQILLLNGNYKGNRGLKYLRIQMKSGTHRGLQLLQAYPQLGT